VLVGRRLCDAKYDGGPVCEFSCPSEPKTLPVLAACALSCEKLRTVVVAKAAARGIERDVASNLEVLSKPEPLEASSRVRDDMVRFWGE